MVQITPVTDPIVTESSLRRILDEYFTRSEKRLEEFIEEKISQEISGVIEVIHDFMKHVDERFNKVEKDIIDLKRSVKSIEIRVTRIENKLDRIEITDQVQDDQLVKHELWHRQAAKKLQLKLS